MAPCASSRARSKWSANTFNAHATVASQPMAPAGLISFPTTGNVRTRKRSGSRSGNRANMMLSRRDRVSRCACFRWRSNNADASVAVG